MAYEKIYWKDYPDETTPLNAENLNHMDQGIYEVSQKLEEAENYVAAPKKVSLNTTGGSTNTITFGKDSKGNYGYYKAGADTFYPFT